MEWLIERLGESSTWRGLTWLLTAVGVALSPDQTEAVIAAGMAIAGLLGAFTKEQPKQVNITLPKIETQPLSQFDESGFNTADRHSADDGYISRDVLRSRLRDAAMPTRSFPKEHDERVSDEPGFNG